MNDPMTTPDGITHRLNEALEELESPGCDPIATAEAVRTYALASIALELCEMRKLMAHNAFVNGPGLFAQSNRAQ